MMHIITVIIIVLIGLKLIGYFTCLCIYINNSNNNKKLANSVIMMMMSRKAGFSGLLSPESFRPSSCPISVHGVPSALEAVSIMTHITVDDHLCFRQKSVCASRNGQDVIVEIK